MKMKSCKGCGHCNKKGKPSVARNSKKCFEIRKVMDSRGHEIGSTVKQNKVYRKLKKGYDKARGRR